MREEGVPRFFCLARVTVVVRLCSISFSPIALCALINCCLFSNPINKKLTPQ